MRPITSEICSDSDSESLIACPSSSMSCLNRSSSSKGHLSGEIRSNASLPQRALTDSAPPRVLPVVLGRDAAQALPDGVAALERSRVERICVRRFQVLRELLGTGRAEDHRIDDRLAQDPLE